jgi:acyl-CoA hydrolase
MQPLMVSVNSALQVDLFAQANASRVRGVIYSGFGGQIIDQVAHPSVRDELRDAARGLGFPRPRSESQAPEPSAAPPRACSIPGMRL